MVYSYEYFYFATGELVMDKPSWSRVHKKAAVVLGIVSQLKRNLQSGNYLMARHLIVTLRQPFENLEEVLSSAPILVQSSSVEAIDSAILSFKRTLTGWNMLQASLIEGIKLSPLEVVELWHSSLDEVVKISLEGAREENAENN